MATVRDPAFWKRFSTAVHLNDVEMQQHSVAGSRSDGGMSGKTTPRPGVAHQDSWLGKQQRKKKKRTIICWSFWLGTMAFAAIITVVIIWLIRGGYFDKLQKKIQGAS